MTRGGCKAGGHSNLFVGNLQPGTTEAALREAFNGCGAVVSCRVFERNGRTCALVKMETVQAAEKACGLEIGGDLQSRWQIKFADTDVGGSRMDDGKGKDKGKGKFKGMMFGGKGKGYFWGFGWGKGKGKTEGQLMLRVSPELKVWIGNLAEGTEWKELQTHMNAAGKTVWVEVFTGAGKGTGAVVYATPEDAQNAVKTLNGTALGGQDIIVDVWEKKIKEPANLGDPPAEATAQGED